MLLSRSCIDLWYSGQFGGRVLLCIDLQLSQRPIVPVVRAHYRQSVYSTEHVREVQDSSTFSNVVHSKPDIFCTIRALENTACINRLGVSEAVLQTAL